MFLYMQNNFVKTKNHDIIFKKIKVAYDLS